MDMLQRMVEAGEVTRFRDHEGQAYVHMLTNPNLKLRGNWYNRQHELSCADVFISLYHTGRLEHWDYRWTKQEEDYYGIKRLKVYYDRKFVVDGKVFFLEVDRGTEDPEQLEDKIRKYKDFSTNFPDEWFYVLFAVQGSRYYKLSERLKWIMKLLDKHTPGKQFLVTEQQLAEQNPLGEIYISAQDSKPTSILSLKL